MSPCTGEDGDTHHWDPDNSTFGWTCSKCMYRANWMLDEIYPPSPKPKHEPPPSWKEAIAELKDKGIRFDLASFDSEKNTITIHLRSEENDEG